VTEHPFAGNSAHVVDALMVIVTNTKNSVSTRKHGARQVGLPSGELGNVCIYSLYYDEILIFSIKFKSYLGP
jgi:hypothetical protein